MPLKVQEIQKLARVVDDALVQAYEIERLTATFADLSLSDAYLIQDEGIRFRRIRGEREVGYKMGLTSEAKRKQMNLDAPIYGILTDKMQLSERQNFSLTGSIHPKIEPEIAFIIEKELSGKVTPEQALAACAWVCPALEILDSRFLNFKYFSLPDVVADNCSSSKFVLGQRKFSAREFQVDDLARLELTMQVNGKVVESAVSSAVSGNPVYSLVELCSLLDSRGLSLKAGSIVLTGAATAAIALEPGSQIDLEVEKLGNTWLKTIP
ncbi:MAG: fumarylacetoacetate hydrolase family protein [Bdellovibrionota bacterium]